MWRGTEHVIALFAVFTIVNPKRRREQTEGEHRERHGLRATWTVKTRTKTLFEVLTPVFIDFQHYATLCSGHREN